MVHKTTLLCSHSGSLTHYSVGADIHSRNNIQSTSLHLAAESGHIDVVKYLIEKGADVSATNVYRMKPWHAACVRKCGTEIIQLLIQHGADVDVTSKHGLMALHHAASCGALDTVKLLVEKGIALAYLLTHLYSLIYTHSPILTHLYSLTCT